jgi:hypothetical protein
VTIAKEILLFGGSRAGKTTLLASMWDVSKRLFLEGKELVYIDPDEDSSVFLSQQIRALKEAFREDLQDSPFVVVPPTTHPGSYTLRVGRDRKKDAFAELAFTDTPGGYSTEAGEIQNLTSRFQCSQIGILVIDTVELFHGLDVVPIDKRRNNPELSQVLIHKWLEWAPVGDLLLCIVPVKTEGLLRAREGADTEEGVRRLHARVRSEYRELFADLARHQDHLAVVLCPLQTVGNLVFHDWAPPAPGEIYPQQVYRKVVGAGTDSQPATGYAPLDGDQPLRHVLNFLLIAEIERRRKMGIAEFIRWMMNDETRGAFDAVRTLSLDLFGRDRDLVRAVSSFVRHTKTEPPFDIVQGAHIIRRSSVLWDRLDGLMERYGARNKIW